MDAVLSGKGVSVAYHQNIVIPAMDVQIPRGRITSVIGPNGCGKSTLLKALSRMTPIREGHVLLDGRQIAKMSTVEVAKKMAILPQGPQAPGGLTVKELVAYGRYPHQKGFGTSEEGRPGSSEVGVVHHRYGGIGRQGYRCSFRRAVGREPGIAMALAQDTPLILLDRADHVSGYGSPA